MRMGLVSTALSALMLASPPPAAAQTAEPVRRYEVAPGPLDRALTAFAQQSGQQILYPAALVAGRRSPGLSGDYTADAALAALLRDTGLVHRRTRPNVFVVYDPAARVQGADLAEPAILEEVVVTGSWFRGAASPSPVTVIGQADLERQGRATMAEVLAALPQNFTGGAYEGSAGTGADRSGRNTHYATGVNLRGLGADATLVLVNGRRIAGTGNSGDFADVSNIPTSAIERVDVLLDGASALYGADAVGGVVNVILRRDFDGMETRARIGGTSDGGAAERLFSHTAGLDWDGGNAVLSYEWMDRGELQAADRRATASADLRPLGGSDWRDFYASPGNIMSFDPVTGAFVPAWAIPAGQDGTGLTPADFLAGVVNRFDQQAGRWALPHQTRHSVFAALSQSIGGGVVLDADLRYTRRDYEHRSYADIGILTVTEDNPYFVSPDGATMHEIAYAFDKDLGPGVDLGRSRSLGGSIGIEGEVRGWNVSAYVSGGREANRQLAVNRAQQTYLLEALGAVPDDPATAFDTAVDGFFNPYGDPAANSPAVLDFIGQGYSDSRGVSTVASANLKVDGALFDLPGGPLRLALGADYRHEAFETEGVNFFYGSTPQVGTPRRNDREIVAGFVELRAPLVDPAAPRPGLHRLELSLAGRVEQHQGVGSTATPKLGVLYAPSADLLLRASYGESFRAPSLPELYSRYQLGPTVLSDGLDDVITLVQYGGNPELRPETARSLTAGFVWTPSALDGFRLEGGWFRTEFTDRISQPVIENVAGALSNPALAAFVTRIEPASDAADLALIESLLAHPGNFLPDYFPAEAYGAIVDTRYVNAAALEVEGVDLSGSYAFELAGGELALDATTTRLFLYDRQITPDSPFEALVGVPNFPVEWRGRFGGVWTRGPLSLGLAANHVAGGFDPVGDRPIGSWTTLDGQVRYDFPEAAGTLKGLSLTLNVLNLLNEEPPFYDAPQGLGYDAANTNVLGRQLSLQLVKRW